MAKVYVFVLALALVGGVPACKKNDAPAGARAEPTPSSASASALRGAASAAASKAQHDCFDPGTAPAKASLTRAPAFSATRQGKVLIIAPLGRKLSVPAPFDGAVVLTRPAEMRGLETSSSEWNGAYATILNAALPFDACIAHLAEEGWQDGVSFGDVTMRLYAVRESEDEVARAIATGATSAAHWVGCTPRSSFGASGWTENHERRGAWRRTAVSAQLWYGDYGGTARVDLRFRRKGEGTIVVAFFYEGAPREDEPRRMTDAIDAVDAGAAGAAPARDR